MTNPYRALSAELLAVFDSYDDESNLVGIFDDMKANKNDLLDRARALLDQPVAEESDAVHPFVVRHYMDDERPSIKGNGFDGLEIGEDRQEAEEFITWINKRICPTPQPVAVNERLPGPEDCDEQGRCWWGEPQIESSYDATWTLCTQKDAEECCTWGTKGGWLPANALPTPEVTND